MFALTWYPRCWQGCNLAESPKAVQINANVTYKSRFHFIDSQEHQVDGQQSKELSPIGIGARGIIRKIPHYPTSTFGALQYEGCRANLRVQFFDV